MDDILVDTGTTLQAELDGIQADTEDIQTRLPVALVGGRMDATVDATGMEAGAVSAIADGVWEEAIADHSGTVGSTAEALADAGGAGTPPTVGAIADAVWDEATAGHTTSGTFGEQVKTDIDDILTDTGTTLQAEVDGIQADTEDIQTGCRRPSSAAGLMRRWMRQAWKPAPLTPSWTTPSGMGR